tara:strand:- start:133223 stop:133342 length:120 start_codon:yes stop_codon:yes gene_type:complete
LIMKPLLVKIFGTDSHTRNLSTFFAVATRQRPHTCIIFL